MRTSVSGRAIISAILVLLELVSQVLISCDALARVVKVSFLTDGIPEASNGDDPFSEDSAGLRVGESIELGFTMEPEDAQAHQLRFTCDVEALSLETDPDRMRLKATLLKKPTGKDSLSVQVYHSDGKNPVGRLNIKLFNKPISKITLSAPDDIGDIWTIAKGQTVMISKLIEPEDTTDSELAWDFYDDPNSDSIYPINCEPSDYLTLGADGSVTGREVTPFGVSFAVVARAAISDGSEIESNPIRFCVEEVSAERIAIEGLDGAKVTESDLGWSNLSMKPNQTARVKAVVFPEGASDKSVEWSLSPSYDSSDDVLSIFPEGDGSVLRLEAGSSSGRAYVFASSPSSFISQMLVVAVADKPVEGVEVRPGSVTMTLGDDPIQLEAIVTPEDASIKEVEWSSDDENVAKVDSSGRISAIGVGDARIVATTADGGKTAHADVKVNPVHITGIILRPSSSFTEPFRAGDTLQLVADITPANATIKDLDYASSDESVAIVNQSGLVTAVHVGNASIIAKAKDGSGKEGTFAVTVAKTPVESVIVEPGGQISLERSLKRTLAARVMPETATVKDIIWSSDSSAVSVDQNGVVEAKAASGSAVITATSADDPEKFASVTVNCEELKLRAVKLAVNRMSLKVGGMSAIGAYELSPSDEVTVASVQYSSDNEGVATVDENGNVTAIGPGTCFITCRITDNVNNVKADSCQVSVGGFVEFSFSSDGSLRCANGKPNWNGTIEHSTDLENWSRWTGGKIESENGELFLRGSGVTSLTGHSAESNFDDVISNRGYWILESDDEDSSVRVSGDIRNLLDYDGFDSITTIAEGAFDGLFYGCGLMTDASGLVLAAPSAKGVYANMFRGCSSLTAIPSLKGLGPLSAYCYSGMFQDCRLLERTGVLDAVMLAEGCYQRMFKGCSSLEAISVLPSSSLPALCYEEMFSGCASLRFHESLSDAQSDPAAVSGSVRAFWFGGSAQEDSLSGCIEETGGSYSGNVRSGRPYWLANEVEHFGELASVLISKSSLSCEVGDMVMLSARISPSSARQDVVWSVLSGSSFVSVGYSGAITALAAGNAVVRAKSAVDSSVYADVQMSVAASQEGTSKALEFFSDGAFSISAGVGTARKSWDGAILFSQSGTAGAWNEWKGEEINSASGSDGKHHLFFKGIGNSRIAALSASGAPTLDGKWSISGSGVSAKGDVRLLLDHSDAGSSEMADYCFYHLFEGCFALTAAPRLGAAALSRGCYEGMFQETGLIEPPALPATTLAARCYRDMFNGCVNLESVPVLESDGFEDDCYSGMFRGCRKLEFSDRRDGKFSNEFAVASSLSGSSGGKALSGMFNGTGGDFTLDPIAGGTYWTANELVCSSPVEAASVNLSASSVSMEPMQKIRLAHSVLPENATNQLVSWSSNDTNVATVDDRGIVSAKSAGSVTITAQSKTSSSLSAEIALQVEKSQAVEFISPAFFRISTANSQKNWNGTISYRTGSGEWTAWSGESAIEAQKAEGDTRYRIFMKGSGNSRITGMPSFGEDDLKAVFAKRWVIDGKNVDCSGDLSNLLESGNDSSGQASSPAMSEYCFAGMFYGCSALISAPSLDMTALAEGCYRSMFQDCPNLIIGCELPATALKEGCYRSMFRDCASLVVPPIVLPSTSAEEYCYAYMFSGCSSMTQAPSFDIASAHSINSSSEVVMMEGIARAMFKDCSSLRRIDISLSARYAGREAYYEMFSGCSSLRNAPDIGARTIGAECMYRMFYDCSSLVEGPERLPALSLPAGEVVLGLRKGCYQEMFSGCVSLQDPPVICATTLSVACFAEMFNGCRSLSKLPAIAAETFPESASYACYGMFMNCSSISLKRSRTDDHPNGYWVPRMVNPKYETAARMFMGTQGDLAASTASYHGVEFYVSNPIVWPYGMDEFTLKAVSGKEDPHSLNVGESMLLAVVPAKRGADPSVTWRSLNESVAVVDSNGRVSALAAGSAVITATSATAATADGVTAEFMITVAEDSAQEVRALRFSSANGVFKLKSNNGIQWDGRLEYSASYPSADWTLWRGEEISSAAQGSSQVLYLRGQGNHFLTGQSTDELNRWVIEGSGVRCDGDIRSLFDYLDFDAKGMWENACANLFYRCSALVSAPLMAANDVETGCYFNMFAYCSSLIELPEGMLPVTELRGGSWKKGCYEGMFRGCSSLAAVPSLPATALAPNCYRSMFAGCVNLENVPADLLPAVSFGTGDGKAVACYREMFRGCSSLANVPSLPAQALVGDYDVGGCYQEMFEECRSLTEVPEELFSCVKSLDIVCCKEMFKGCVGMTKAPRLFAADMGFRSCQGMFENCSSLMTAPQLPSAKMGGSCYEAMFRGCSSLIGAPALGATALASSCYESMFENCSSLLTAPSSLPARTLASSCYESMFAGCSSLAAVPSLPATAMARSCYMYMFKGCASLTSVPYLRWKNLESQCFMHMFEDCSSLRTLPTNMLSSNEHLISSDENGDELADYCYADMFRGCVGLEQLPSSFTIAALKMGEGCFMGMFAGCSSLRSIPASLLSNTTALPESACMNMFENCAELTLPEGFTLPADDLGKWVYANMFKGCSSIKSLPESLDLPATHLAMLCYACMFQNCGNLEFVKKDLISATQLADYCFFGMFSGCGKLQTPPSLPSVQTLPMMCYASMFEDCVSLSAVPVFSATKAGNGSCLEMFLGCSNLQFSKEMSDVKGYLNEIVLPAADTGVGNAFESMFALTGGEFRSTPQGGRSYWTRNETI